MSGAISSGPLASIVDVAPNYAGVLQGINGAVVACCISISPYIVGLITFQQVINTRIYSYFIPFIFKSLRK